MEEAELLKERLQAITDKRKIQEDIAQRRIKIEEEKLKLHHLKKKALREKWLLDGLSTLSPEEQEDIVRQNQEDQQQIKHLESSTYRLEQEIDDLEKEEIQISTREVCLLQRLKSVERTTEDIIKAVKAEVREEPVHDIYAGIPDLPLSYKPSFVKRMESETQEDGEEPRKALFAMEIKVEKDMKSGKSTVLSTIPVPSSEFEDSGVKVYDDGRKSIYALKSEGRGIQNGVDTLAPVEVEDLLKKATEKRSESPTEYHEPVFSNAYGSSTQKGYISPRMNGHTSPHSEIGVTQNGIVTKEAQSYPTVPREVSRIKGPFPEKSNISHNQSSIETQADQTMSEHTDQPDQSMSEHTNQPDQTMSEHTNQPDQTMSEHTNQPDQTMSEHTNRPDQTMSEHTNHQLTPQRNHHEEMPNSLGGYNTGFPSLNLEDDMHYNVVQATPCYADDSEPVTMIFMGYKHADDDDVKPISDYEGVIHAELVVIDDDDEDDKRGEEKTKKIVSVSPVIRNPFITPSKAQESIKKPTNQNITFNNQLPYKNSMSLQEQDASLGYNNVPIPTKHIVDDGTEDPSLTALRIRMAKLGKKVI
ncbi:palmdelphin-like [Xenopus laevis]|uniref:Palmdelphin n=2 Tax=Xenopus laevis TaxID=8355 RepID=A0A974D1X0_XENLA|nr:palmdelphin-like [Xenopus laevis]OCT82827.1 hypothetical protein XELAEV_18025361mg [Xenopus laevis]